ncbi:MAG: hypothetical protein DLM53_07270 [Candidatus Eremiobacter antarcticus]|nr:MAG: hypothetical protein DLM53_07270 [Candidatus Eremiobacter sp. RRmetagenome_bin22]
MDGPQPVTCRLVAIDLDGTLIDESLVIDEADAAAVRGARNAGCVVCLASGRLYAASRPFAQALSLTGPIIVLQGSAVYDIASGARLLCTVLAQDVALAAYDDLKARGFHLQLYFGDRLYLDEINEAARFYLDLSRVDPIMVPDLRPLLVDQLPEDPGPMKVLAIGEPVAVSAAIPELADLLGSSASVFKSLPVYLEVTNPDANKGFALAWVAKMLSIPLAETAAIGDSDNDVPMLRVAGRSFAVGNATAAAKQAAHALVPPHGSGGVAAALGELLATQARPHA